MVSTGDTAPDISATIGTSDHEPFELSEHLGDGPVVVAFFPAAFAPVCSNEMVAIEERIDRLEAAGATVFGVSADAAYSLGAFGDEHDLSFDLVSDTRGDALRAYGVETDVPETGRYGIAKRAVFVIDADGEVVYDWVGDELADEPDYEAVLAAVEAA
ncbi:redoxin domain-containing protein [Halorubrum yunnanense]|uniref:Redoxin domain-containing protein n=1 Tax=Halorubrum yunnanense TaxID=1526162 RepID=A0ABD5YF60_9EURY|nr:redoxin domain-containing protein [Halorubrum yunnanense]